MDENPNDFYLQWIYSEYEDGKTVPEIAARIGKDEDFVYTQMRRKPEKYEDVKRIREEIYNLKLRRIRGLADNITLKYLEELSAKLQSKDTTDEEKEAVFEEINKIQKISKQYADRVQITEGKTDKHVSVKGDRPIEVIIRKAYEEEDDTETND